MSNRRKADNHMKRMIHRLQQSRRLLQSSSSSSSSFLQSSFSRTTCSLAPPSCCPLFTPTGSCTTSRRTLTTVASSTKQKGGTGGYIDEWYASIIKSPEFYEEHSQLVDHHSENIEQLSNQQPQRYRCYFYTVDLQGRLFLEETMPKNVATCIKDVKFLNVFFRRLRRLRPHEATLLQTASGIPVEDYPFVSPCRARSDDGSSRGGNGGSTTMEFNLVRPAATPFVFHSLLQLEDDDDDDNNDNSEDRRYVLVYGGDKRQPLEWTRLAISSITGKLYHPIDDTKPDNKQSSSGSRTLEPENMPAEQQQEYALIRSSVAVALSDRIVALDNNNNNNNNNTTTRIGEDVDNDENASGMAILLQSRRQEHDDGNLLDGGDDNVAEQHCSILHPIPWLPREAEPGPWALLYCEMND